MIGIVQSWHATFGYIYTPTQRYFFHVSEFNAPRLPRTGEQVQFEKEPLPADYDEYRRQLKKSKVAGQLQTVCNVRPVIKTGAHFLGIATVVDVEGIANSSGIIAEMKITWSSEKGDVFIEIIPILVDEDGCLRRDTLLYRTLLELDCDWPRPLELEKFIGAKTKAPVFFNGIYVVKAAQS